MKIGNVQLAGNILLAPLAGVTDVSFRELAAEYGASLCYTEMVSVKGLMFGNSASRDLLKVSSKERIKAAQIFGGESKYFVGAIEKGYLDDFDIIDINMGCPVPKVVKNGEGSALMLDIKRAEDIVSLAVRSAKKPVTVKFRKGFDNQHINAVEFAKMCEGAGAAAVTVHGRTRAQMYGGRSDTDIISEVVNAVKIPVIGNGDVNSRETADNLLSVGCAGVMIGRAALGRPWIFSQITDSSFTVDIKKVILRHIMLMRENFSERYTVVNMRKHIAWYLKGQYGGIELKRKIFSINSLDEIVKTITNSEIFS